MESWSREGAQGAPAHVSRFDAFDAVDCPIAFHDLEGRLLFLNKAFCSALGAAREGLLSLSLAQLAPTVDVEDYLQRIRENPGAETLLRAQFWSPGGGAREFLGRARTVMMGSDRLVVLTAHRVDLAPGSASVASPEEVPLTGDREELILETSPDGFWIADAQGRIRGTNEAYCRIVGMSRDEVLACRIPDLEADERPEDVHRRILKIRRYGHDRFRSRHRHKSGRLVDVEVTARFDELRNQFIVFIRDVSSDVLDERIRELNLEILDVLNRPGDWRAALRATVTILQRRLAFPVVALRLREGEDFPYYVEEGLDPECLRPDCSLCVHDGPADPVPGWAHGLDCTCGMVLQGRSQPETPYFTPEGGFWTNDLPASEGALSALDRRWFSRGFCTKQGFRSLALLPLRAGEETLGLLQLADPAPDRFTRALVRYLEGLGAAIGMAVGRKQAEDGLNRYLRFQLELIDNFPVLVWRTDRSGRISYINRTAKDFLEAGDGSPEEYFASGIHPEDRLHVLRTHQQAIESRGAAMTAYRLLRADGEWRHVRERAAPFTDVHGRFAGLLGAVFDETEAVQAGRQLAASEERFRMLFEAMLEGVALLEFVPDPAGEFTDYRILDVNPAFTRHTGLERDAVIGRLAGRELGAALYVDIFSDAARTGTSLTFEAHVDAIRRDLRISAFGLAEGRLGVVVEDITERRASEGELRRSEGMFRQMVERSPIAVQLFDGAGRLVHANRAAYELYGIADPADAAGYNILEDPAMPPEAVDQMRRGEGAAFELSIDFDERALSRPTLRRGRARFEVIVTALEGMPLYAKRSPEPADREEVRPPQAGFQGAFLVQAVDVTDRRRAEENLRRYEMLTGLARDIILLLRREDGRIVDANRAAIEVYGYSRDELLGLGIRDLCADQKLPTDIWSSARFAGGLLFEAVHRRRDGTNFPVEISGAHVAIDGEPHIFYIVRDITERRRSEQAMLQTEKLAALGRLAAATAHEMNQPLNAIKNYCQGLLLNMADRIPMTEERLKNNLGGAVQQVDRMAEIIRNMRIFARQDEPGARAPVVLQQVLAYPGSFLAAQFRSHGIELSERFPEEPLLVLGHENRLHQVFINLMINARDAIQERQEVRPGEGHIRVDLAERDGWAEIVLSDDGLGISDADKDRIFEPFFTTKGTERGTGLGLSICYEIVRQHEGEIMVEDRAGGGAAFRIRLPLWRAPQSGAPPTGRRGSPGGAAS